MKSEAPPFYGHICWLVFCLVAVIAPPAYGAAETEIMAPYSQPPLVWETVTDWQSAPGSQILPASSGRSIVNLSPGDGVWFTAERGSYIRLTGHLVQPELTIRQGDALGLFSPLPMIQTKDGTGLISQASLERRSFIWISNTGKTEAKVGLQRGSYQSVPFVSNWPEAHIREIDAYWLRQNPELALQKYFRVTDSIETFRVSGPVLLGIDVRQSRLEWPSEKRSTLTVQVGQNEPEENLMHFLPQRTHRHNHEGEDVLLSLPERVLVSVPEGDHEIQLQSTTPAWFQVRQLPTRRLLASEKDWNISSEDVALFLRENYSREQKKLKRTAQGVSDPALALAEDHLAFGSPSWADDVGGHTRFNRYTQNRTLLPAGPLPEKLWQPVTATLKAPNRNNNVVDLQEIQQPGHQIFFQLQAGEAPITLPLPITRHPTYLKLQLANAIPGTRLLVKVKDQSYPLVYEPEISLPGQTYPADYQLQSTRQQIRTHPVLAAETRLVLPAGIDRIELQTLQGEGWVNLEVREPVYAEMTEAEFLAALAEQTKQGLARTWRHATRPDDLPPHLWKDGQFLRSWLNYRANSFTRTVSPPLHQRPSPADALEQLSELIKSDKASLANNYAQGILAFGVSSDQKDPATTRVRKRAYDYLSVELDDRESAFAKQTLLAFEYLNHGAPHIAVKLAEELLAEGLAEQALRLIHTVFPTTLSEALQQRLSLLGIRAAALSEWRRSFEQFEKTLPQWRKLYSTSDQWHGWPAGYDSPVQKQAVYNPGLERFYQRLRVTPNQPMELSVIGPARMRIGLNLLHSDRYSRLDDMIELGHNDKTYRLPLLNSGVYNTHRLVSEDTLSPGNLMPVMLELGPGEHQISLAPSKHSLLANWEIAASESASRQQLIQQQTNGSQCAVDQRHFRSTAEQRLARNSGTVITLESNFIPASVELLNSQPTPPMPPDCTAAVGSEETASVSGRLLSVEPAAITEEENQSRSSAASVTSRLSEILDIQDFATRPALIAEANSLAHSYPERDRIQSLLSRINEQQFWDQEEIIISSAGLQSFESRNWPPESGFLEDRYQLLGTHKKEEEFLVFGRTGEGILVNNTESKRYSLQLRLAKVGYQLIPPATLELSVNGEVLRRVTLSQENPLALADFTIPEGQHRINISLLSPSSRHWVFARLRYRSGSDQQSVWNTAIPEQRRYYHWVTREEPFTAYIDRPSWLRIETYDGTQWHTQYDYQPGSGELTLRRDDLKGPFIRLFSLRYQPERERLEVLELTPELSSDAPLAKYNANTAAVLPLIADRLDARPDNSGTHGVFAAIRHRPDFESADDDNERFLEAGYRYRYLQPDTDIFWQSDVFGRAHGSDSIGVLGGRQWISWRPDGRNWRAGLYASGYWQFSGSKNHQAGSVFIEPRFDARMPLGSEFVWQRDVEGFARWLSKSDQSGQAWDNDVFSRYKSDHRYGVNWEESLVFQPYEDARWVGGLGLRTNEDLNPFQPDRFFARIGWQQYYAGTRFDIGAENRWLQADRDRRSADTQTLLDLSATWHGWESAGKRWEFNAGLGYDIDAKQISASMSVSWDLSGARRLRDFRPEQFVFTRRQHIRAANQVHHNLLNYVEEE